MEQNNKRKRHDGGDMTTKKFKEEQVDRRQFYDMFFFDEGLCCDTADVGVDTEEQIQEHFLDERSDDEAKIENASDGENVKLESGSVVKDEINIYDEESISSGSSGTISENENTVAPSSGLLKMKIRLGRINKRLVKKKEPSHTNRNTVKKEFNSPSMQGESRLDLSDGSLSGEEQNKPILTLSERSSKVIANNGKATNLGNNEDETIQRKLHSSSRSRENKLDEKVDTEEQIQEHFLDERSDDEAKIENASDGENVKLESGSVVKEEINIYDEESISSGSSGTISENENTTLTVGPSSGLLKMNIRLGRINKRLVKKKEPSHTIRNTVKKEFNSPSMQGESRLDLSDGSLSGEEENKPILTLSECSSKLMDNNGKAETIQRKLHSSSRSRENKLDEKEIFTDPLCPLKEALLSPLSCITWLRTNGLVMDSCTCPLCGLAMEFRMLRSRNTTKYMWNCKSIRSNGWGRNHPNVRISAIKGSIFYRSRLSLRQVLIIIYYFSQGKRSTSFLIRETSIEGYHRTSCRTIGDYLLFLRQLCQMWLMDNCPKDHTLGSPKHPVELVECDLVPNSPTMTLCFVEHNPEHFSYILDSCSERDSETVTSLVLKYVNDGTMVFSDLLKSLYNENCTHFEVDRENKRLNPCWLKRQGCILNEPVLSMVKEDGPKSRGPLKLLSTHLSEYLYRKEVENMDIDPFWHFIHIIKTYYPTN